MHAGDGACTVGEPTASAKSPGLQVRACATLAWLAAFSFSYPPGPRPSTNQRASAEVSIGELLIAGFGPALPVGGNRLGVGSATLAAPWALLMPVITPVPGIGLGLRDLVNARPAVAPSVGPR